MKKVAFYWDWHGSANLTVDKTYTVLSIRTDKGRDEYLIEDDSGKKRWYDSYLFEEISEVRNDKLKTLLEE